MTREDLILGSILTSLSFLSPLNPLHQEILLALPSENVRILSLLTTSTSTPLVWATLLMVIVSNLVSLLPPSSPWSICSASCQTDPKNYIMSHYSSIQKSSQGPISSRVKAKSLTWPARVLCVTSPSPRWTVSCYCPPCSYRPHHTVLLVVFEHIKNPWAAKPSLCLEYLPLPIQMLTSLTSL